MTSPVGIRALPVCFICSEEIQKNVRQLETTCHHIFCRQCLYQRLTENRDDHCPRCSAVTHLSFRTLFEEDYIVTSACHTTLKAHFETLHNRLLAIIRRYQTATENIRTLKNPIELQATLNLFQSDLDGWCKDLTSAELQLDSIDVVMSTPHDRLLELESITIQEQPIIDLINRTQRRIISQHIPVQEDLEKKQADLNTLAERLERQFPALERRLLEIETLINPGAASRHVSP